LQEKLEPKPRLCETFYLRDVSILTQVIIKLLIQIEDGTS